MKRCGSRSVILSLVLSRRTTPFIRLVAMCCFMSVVSAKPRSCWFMGVRSSQVALAKLAGNHFFTIDTGHEKLTEFGNKILWEGAQEIEFTSIG